MNRIEEVKKYWQQQEAIPSSMFRRWVSEHLEGRERAEVIGYLPNLKGKRILDLAAGIGRFTRHFSSIGHSVISVDLAPQFVEKNRELHADCHNVSFLCADAMDLHFQDQFFDFVFINWLFLYLEDAEIELLLQRIHRWLSPSGILFFRESCDIVRSKNAEYYAHYRTLSFYETALKDRFSILKEGSIQAYIDCFADPMQCYWLVKKT